MCTFSSDRYSIDCEIVHTWDVRKVLTSVTVCFPFFLALHLMMMSEKTGVCVSVCMRVCVYMCICVCVLSCMCICMRLCVCLRTTLLPRQQATSQTRPSTYKRICYVLFVSSWITFDLLANSMALEAGSVRGIFFAKYWCFVLFLWQACRFCLHIRVDVASQLPGGSSWLIIQPHQDFNCTTVETVCKLCHMLQGKMAATIWRGRCTRWFILSDYGVRVSSIGKTCPRQNLTK